MKIAFAVLMIFSLTALLLIWTALLSNPRDGEDLEEQEKYLEEWKKRKNNKKEEEKGKIEWGKGLPKESGRYVCITKFGEAETYEYSGTYKMFNVSDDDDYKSAVNTCINEHILCWVPKEEFLKMQGFKRKEIEKWRD